MDDLNKVVVGTDSISLESLDLNDSFNKRGYDEMSGPSPVKPIVFELLNLKNENKAMNHIDFQKMTMTEGKNRMIEQIDDSNLLKDSELNKIRKESAMLLLNRVKRVVSYEAVLGYKCIQVVFLIETGLLSQYRHTFYLEENIEDEKLKEINSYNKKLNNKMRDTLNFIDNELIYKLEKLEKDYMNNPDVSQAMKDHLQTVGVQWIKDTKSTNTIYKSFRRKAKMDKKQSVIFTDFVNKIREQSRKTVEISDILKFFNIDIDYYNEYKDVALKPIDDLLDSYESFEY